MISSSIQCADSVFPRLWKTISVSMEICCMLKSFSIEHQKPGDGVDGNLEREKKVKEEERNSMG